MKRHPDPIHRRRMVLHGVIKTIGEQIPLEGVAPELALEAWKQFFGARLWPGLSSEDVIRGAHFQATVLRIESWAADRGVTFGSEVAA